jgi:uncharacterized protein
MTGETNLSKLLSSMSPKLLEGEYVFSSFKGAQYGEHSELKPIAAISESEGLTLIIPKSVADENNIAYGSSFKGITLSVHSSLDAVGLTAAFSNKLAEHGISANVLAGYCHDHIFVQTEFAQKALAALKTVSQ